MAYHCISLSQRDLAIISENMDSLFSYVTLENKAILEKFDVLYGKCYDHWSSI